MFSFSLFQCNGSSHKYDFFFVVVGDKDDSCKSVAMCVCVMFWRTSSIFIKVRRRLCVIMNEKASNPICANSLNQTVKLGVCP